MMIYLCETEKQRRSEYNTRIHDVTALSTLVTAVSYEVRSTTPHMHKHTRTHTHTHALSLTLYKYALKTVIPLLNEYITTATQRKLQHTRTHIHINIYIHKQSQRFIQNNIFSLSLFFFSFLFFSFRSTHRTTTCLGEHIVSHCEWSPIRILQFK